MICKTRCMTFPRSGHGLLLRLLEAYLGADEFAYCQVNMQPTRRFDSDAGTRFQNSHDIELDTPIDDDCFHLVQIRYPIESIVSWYRKASKEGGVADDPHAWQQFAILKASFWMRFYKKWVLGPIPNRHIVNYADLVLNPEESLSAIVSQLIDGTPDSKRIEGVCALEKIQRLNRVHEFRYFGPAFMSILTGFFAAVPGIDVETGTLVVPSSSTADPLHRVAAPIIPELAATARRLDAFARRLTEAQIEHSESTRQELADVCV